MFRLLFDVLFVCVLCVVRLNVLCLLLCVVVVVFTVCLNVFVIYV